MTIEKTIIDLLDKEYKNFERNSIEYIQDRGELFDDEYGKKISKEMAKEKLYDVEANGDYENTLWEQGYLRGLQEAQSLIKFYFNNQKKND